MEQRERTFAQKASPPTGGWSPRFWVGATFGALWRVYARNRFKVAPSLLIVALLDLVLAANNSLWAFIERRRFGHLVAQTKLVGAPVFIVGHWRSGTTLLHELLALDPRHTYPTTYACISPSTFLLTEENAHRFDFMKPKQRPMDAIPVEWDSPLEDEFALCNLGVPSPYETIAFPNDGPRNQAYLDLVDLPAPERKAWMASLDHFFRKLTLRDPKRLVVKSPTHTYRIDTLLEMYPDAKFVHIVRDPYRIYASTMHLWRAMWAKQGFQRPHYDGLEEYVLSNYEHMEARIAATRSLVPAGQWHEVRYEELIEDPIAGLERVYEALDLGDFAPARTRVAAYLGVRRAFPKGGHTLDDAARAKVDARWMPLAARYGYGDDERVVRTSGIVPVAGSEEDSGTAAA